MDFNNFFRGFFRSSFDDPFASMNRPSCDSWTEDEDSEEPNPPMDFFGNDMPHFLQEMEDMFNNMFISPLRFDDSFALETPVNPESPRDLMLKSPDSDSIKKPRFSFETLPPQGFCKPGQQPALDSDLDDKVAHSGLNALKDDNPVTLNLPSSNRSFSKFVSKRIVRLPNGTTEEHFTTTDSDGNKITSVKKSVGDKTYEVVTKTNKDGLIEKKEDFINMDENELPEFQKRWENVKSRQIVEKTPLPFSAPAGDPKYWSIFQKFFGKPSDSRS